MEGCDAEKCTCQYLGVTSLRRGSDRRSDTDRRESARVKLDRRSGRERRRGSDIWKGLDQ